MVPRVGGLRVTEVTPQTIEGLYLDLAQHGKRAGACRTSGVTCRAHGCSPERHDGLAPKSLRHVHGALRGVLARVVEDGHLPRNPAEADRARGALPRAGAGTQRVRADAFWSDVEARRFLAATAGDHPAGALWATLLGTGMCRGEAVALRWTDVDLDGGAATVRRSTTVVRGATVETSGKTAAAERTVPLPTGLVAVLRAHRARQTEDRLAVGAGWVDRGHVFTEADGRPIHPSRVSERFHAACKVAGVPSIGVHGCRHTAATAMLREGVPVTTVARVLGHADPGITLKVYAHAVPSDDALASAAVERAMFTAAAVS